MVRWFNRRYNPIYEQWVEEQSPSKGGRKDDDPYQWLGGDATPAASGWEALKGGG